MTMLSEVQAIQNPALGAGLIWRFACGYCPPDSATDGVPFPLMFVVLPLLLNEDTQSEISSTRAGIYKFEEKYKDKYDLLYSIQGRAGAMRDLSMRSLSIGIATGLLTLVPENGDVWPNNVSAPRSAIQTVSDMLKSAEKLGGWARDVSLFELARTLHLEF